MVALWLFGVFLIVPFGVKPRTRPLPLRSKPEVVAEFWFLRVALVPRRNQPVGLIRENDLRQK